MHDFTSHVSSKKECKKKKSPNRELDPLINDSDGACPCNIMRNAICVCGSDLVIRARM